MQHVTSTSGCVGVGRKSSTESAGRHGLHGCTEKPAGHRGEQCVSFSLQSLSSAAQSQRPHAAIKRRWYAGALAAATSAYACSLVTRVEPILLWAEAQVGKER